MSRPQRLFLLLWLAAWLGVGWLMLTPIPPEVSVSDKLAHGVTYFLLSSLPFSFCTGHRSLFWAATLTLCAGSGLEYAQSFVPGRSFELADVAANAAGTVAGYAMATMVLVLSRLRTRAE